MVSVVIINYNTFQLTCDCIASVYQNTKGVPFEVILVDNASTERDPQAFLIHYAYMQQDEPGFCRG